MYIGYSSFQLIRDYLLVKYHKGLYKTLCFVICDLCHQLLESYKGLCIYANVLYPMKSHWCIDFSLYKILSKTLYSSSEEMFTKSWGYTYGVILFNFYEDNSCSYFIKIFMRIIPLQSPGVIFFKFFFGDTLYSFSYSKDTNIHVFNHSTSWKDSVLGNFRC